jgi:hypothetical protein
MTHSSNLGAAQTLPGKAVAEAGVVILDGPDGIAVTMTAYAALETGKSLVEAARLAGEQRGRL